MTYNNFSISAGKGKLYLKEKQPTEGYEEVTYGTEGKKTYHKYFNSIKGVPSYLDSKEVQFDGRTLRFLELTLIDGDVSNKISVPLKNKGGYTDEVKLLLSALDGLELGEEVTLSTAKSAYKNKKGEDKEQLNIYINYVNILNDAGKGLSTGFIPYDQIPKPTSKVVAGDTTWDWTEQTEFYYAKLTSILAKFSSAPKQEKPAPQPKTEAQVQNTVPPQTPEQAFPTAGELKTEADFQPLPF
jgi:hypothetical protein